ncbi:hypothetical protein HDU97_007263, partial [Phlyctochytrium planicorne]
MSAPITSKDLRKFGYSDDVYKTAPPPFGRQMRKLFVLDDGYTSLNHGSFGTTPLPVFQYRAAILSQIESNPDLFYKFQIQSMLESTLTSIANYIKTDPRDIAFVENATTGVNVALRSIKPIMRKAGAVKGKKLILQLSTVYHYVGLATAYTAKNEGLEIRSVDVAYPISDDEIVKRVKAAIEGEEAKGNTVVLAVFDAVTSVPGVVIPLWHLIPLCRSHSIFTVVDAAHAVGQVPLHPILALDPDLLVTNLHKWMYAPRGTAILYHSPRHHRFGNGGDAVVAHPTLSDVGTPEWKRSFMWMGTSDVSRYIASGEAIKFREWIGGEDKIMGYCHGLAVKGGELVAKMWGTEVLLGVRSNGDGRSTEGHSLYASMVNVKVPDGAKAPAGSSLGRSEYLGTVQELLMKRFGMSAQLYQHVGVWYVRFSAQIYNDLNDFEAVARTLLGLFNCGNIRGNQSVTENWFCRSLRHNTDPVDQKFTLESGHWIVENGQTGVKLFPQITAVDVAREKAARNPGTSPSSSTGSVEKFTPTQSKTATTSTLDEVERICTGKLLSCGQGKAQCDKNFASCLLGAKNNQGGGFEDFLEEQKTGVKLFPQITAVDVEREKGSRGLGGAAASKVVTSTPKASEFKPTTSKAAPTNLDEIERICTGKLLGCGQGKAQCDKNFASCLLGAKNNQGGGFEEFLEEQKTGVKLFPNVGSTDVQREKNARKLAPIIPTTTARGNGTATASMTATASVQVNNVAPPSGLKMVDAIEYEVYGGMPFIRVDGIGLQNNYLLGIGPTFPNFNNQSNSTTNAPSEVWSSAFNDTGPWVYSWNPAMGLNSTVTGFQTTSLSSNATSNSSIYTAIGVKHSKLQIESNMLFLVNNRAFTIDVLSYWYLNPRQTYNKLVEPRSIPFPQNVVNVDLISALDSSFGVFAVTDAHTIHYIPISDFYNAGPPKNRQSKKLGSFRGIVTALWLTNDFSSLFVAEHLVGNRTLIWRFGVSGDSLPVGFASDKNGTVITDVPPPNAAVVLKFNATTFPSIANPPSPQSASSVTDYISRGPVSCIAVDERTSDLYVGLDDGTGTVLVYGGTSRFDAPASGVVGQEGVGVLKVRIGVPFASVRGLEVDVVGEGKVVVVGGDGGKGRVAVVDGVKQTVSNNMNDSNEDVVDYEIDSDDGNIDD